MDLKTLLGNDYREGMTLEEVDAALSERKLIDKSLFDKTASELSAARKKVTQLESSTLTVEEQLKKAQEEAQETKSRYARELSALRAKEILVGAGLKESEYTAVLPAVIRENEDETKALAEGIVAMLKARETAMEKDLTARLMAETPKPAAPVPTAGMKEKWSGMTLTEKALFKQRHPDEYKMMMTTEE